MCDLRWRALIIAVEFCHASHIKGAKTSHHPLSILVVLPHLRVVLSQFAVSDERSHRPLVFVSIPGEATGVTLPVFLTLFATFNFLVGEEVCGFVTYGGHGVLLQELSRVR